MTKNLTLIENPIAATAQASLDDLYLTALTFARAPRTAADRANTGTPSGPINTTGDRSDKPTHKRARSSTLGRLFIRLDFTGIGPTLGQILIIGVHIYAFLVDDDFVRSRTGRQQTHYRNSTAYSFHTHTPRARRFFTRNLFAG